MAKFFINRPIVAMVIALLMVSPTFFVVRQLTYHPYDWQRFAANWEPGSGDEFAKALAEGRPVLFEFTADWCGNCHALEAFVFQAPGRVRSLRRPLAERTMGEYSR